MNVICPVFICNDIKKTLAFYVNILGFRYADHLDNIERFATIYRDSIEIILVEKEKGNIESNIARYGSGEDAYICPDTIESVDELYSEFVEKNVKIVYKPELKSYGSYEFSIEDNDGRIIGIGRIKERKAFFLKSNCE